MARGVRIEKVYTGKALKVYEKIQKLETELKAAKEELKVAYKEQIKLEKLENQKAIKEEREALLKAIQESDKSPDEIIAFLTK